MNILAIGAHRDDCEIGAGGVIVKAVKKGHRVVLVTVCGGGINDWCISKGKTREYREWTIRKAREMGVEKILLPFSDKGIITDSAARKKASRKLAEIILKVKPDIVFLHHRFEAMPADHGIVGEISEQAVNYANIFMGGKNVKYRGEMYAYEVSPIRHFPPYPLFQPDIYIDIGDVIRQAVETPNYFDRLYALSKHGKIAGMVRSKIKIDYLGDNEIPLSMHGELKLTLASYRGFQCDVRYAEAFMAMGRKEVSGKRLLSEI